MTKSQYAWKIYEMETGRSWPDDLLAPWPGRIKTLMSLSKDNMRRLFLKLLKEELDK